MTVHLVNATLEELRRTPTSAVLFAFPYCVKNMGCPANRFSEECIAECRLCSVSNLLEKLAKLGIEYYIILQVDVFLRFLEENRGRIQALMGCGCDISTKKFLQYTSKKLGYKGVAFTISGETCNEIEYKSSYISGSAKQTYMDIAAIGETLEALYGHL